MEYHVEDVSTQGKPVLQKADVPRQSNFLLTVSTNFRPKSDNQSLSVADKLRKAFKTLFARRNFPLILSFQKGSVADLLKASVEYNVELGHDERGRRIHGHAIIKITHKCNLKLDLPYLREVFPLLIDDSRIQSVYVNVRMLPSDLNAEEYIRKTGYAPGDFDAIASGQPEHDADGIALTRQLENLALG